MKKVTNPLTIIGAFATIAEISVTVGLVNVSPDLQKYFLWFVIGFPVLLVVLFFGTLNKNPKVLYAPSDFEDEKHFMQLLQQKVVDAEITIKQMKEIIKPIIIFSYHQLTHSGRLGSGLDADTYLFQELNKTVSELHLENDSNISNKILEYKFYQCYDMLNRVQASIPHGLSEIAKNTYNDFNTFLADTTNKHLLPSKSKILEIFSQNKYDIEVNTMVSIENYIKLVQDYQLPFGQCVFQ